MSERDERQEMKDRVSAFLDSNPYPAHLATFLAFIEARPAISTPQMSDLEATKERRYEYAFKIQAQVRKVPSSQINIGKDENGEDKFEPFRLDAMHVSTILLVPMSTLEEGGWLDCKLWSVELYHNLQLVVNLVKHFLTDTQAERDPASVPSIAGKEERKKCRRRDDPGCIFQHTSDPRVTSILTSSWNNNLDTVYATSSVAAAFCAFFSEDIATELKSLLADPAELRSSDKYWNMLNMSANLRSFWSDAYFGLLCKDISPHKGPKKTNRATDEEHEALYDVAIQFNWLWRRWEKPNDRITLEGDDNEFMKMAERQIKYERDRSPSYKSNDGATIAAWREDINSPLLSGQEFTITMPEEDAKKCKLVLDFQWAIIRIAAMSGAAGYPDLLHGRHDWIKAKLFRE